jgi:SAM-dependent methyltransferase
MGYQPALYRGSAPFYARGRPPYSRDLRATLERLVPLDGRGRLLDVGTGPGVLAIELARCVRSVVAVDPDADMLVEGRRLAAAAGIENIEWLRSSAEDLDRVEGIAPGTFRLATFGQSFQWTERERVAETVYDLLEPRGALALITHVVEGHPVPEGPGQPPIPHAAVRAVIERFLGPRRRAGHGLAALAAPPADRYEDALARTRFGRPECHYAAGRPDIVRDIDGVIANYFSMSYCAPHLFGDRLGEFEAALRRELQAHSPSGLFWDWPGETEILLARRA